MTYNNYQASLIDAIQKLALFCVLYFLIVLATRFFVRRDFYKQLGGLIGRVDDEVHSRAGRVEQKQTVEAMHQRFAYMLSFSTVYRHQMIVDKLEKLFDDDIDNGSGQKQLKVEGLKSQLKELHKQDQVIEE